MAKEAAKRAPPKVNRQKLLAESIAACRNASGQIIPERVVEAARDPTHYLHSDFEWDDSVAAHRDRIRTAAALIREVKFLVEYEEKKIVVPYYVSDPRADESSYIATLKVAKSKNLSEQVLRDELRRIKQAIHRAMGLACAVNLAADFEHMLQDVVKIETEVLDRQY